MLLKIRRYKMFGLEYIIAFIKVALQVAVAIVSAIPFMLSWNAVVPVYFATYVPIQLHHIGYWHFVGIILVFSFLGEQIGKITPTFVRVEQKVEKKEGK
jgi:hypothetical protein